MNKLKVFHAQGWGEYSRWFPNREIVKTIEEADVVVFEGGDDVSPVFYDEPAHHTTRSNIKRDYYEKELFNKAQALGKPCIGICRGSQFLSVMSGGKLVQHQANPLYIHPMQTYDNKELIITSTHHQAAYPYNLPKEDYNILAWTNDMSDYHFNGFGQELKPEKECEIVHYKKTNSLGIQGHPELLVSSHDTIKYLQNLLTKFLNKEL